MERVGFLRSGRAFQTVGPEMESGFLSLNLRVKIPFQSMLFLRKFLDKKKILNRAKIYGGAATVPCLLPVTTPHKIYVVDRKLF